MVPNQFGPPGQTVPIKFGPPGQMVPNQFGPHTSKSSELVPLDIENIRDHLSRGTKLLGTICPWGQNWLGTVCPEGPINFLLVFTSVTAEICSRVRNRNDSSENPSKLKSRKKCHIPFPPNHFARYCKKFSRPSSVVAVMIY